jgi:hypothetical protein
MGAVACFWNSFGGVCYHLPNQPNSFSINAESGAKSLNLTGYHDSSPYGGIPQLVNTLPGENYTLSFYVGSQGGTASVSVGTGGTPTIFSNLGGSGFWQQFTANFTATGPTELTFTGTAASGSGRYIGLDNVTLTDAGPAATPKPGSFALVSASGTGLFGLLAVRRRRAKRLSA